jgi:mono/diheme cytochrome c family protein
MSVRVLLAVLAVGACDWDFNRMNEQVRCEPGDSRPWLPDRRCEQRWPAGTIAWRTTAQAMPAPATTRDSILRGRDRFARMCASCHGPLEDGNSVIAEDMVLRRPPSLLAEPVVGYPDQRIFDVISHGYGLMPSYSFQLAPPDRWAIVHFLRVLQLSQSFPLAQLSAQRRQEAERWLE